MLVNIHTIEWVWYSPKSEYGKDCQNFIDRLDDFYTIEIKGDVYPKCLLITSIAYKYGRGLNTLCGQLLSIDFDTFHRKSRELNVNINDLYKQCQLAEIIINYRTEQNNPITNKDTF